MNKILVIKHNGAGGKTTAEQRIKVAKSIYDAWEESGVIVIPCDYHYEFIDCDKFMGVTIDKDIANERFENGCQTWSIYNPFGVSTSPLHNPINKGVTNDRINLPVVESVEGE